MPPLPNQFKPDLTKNPGSPPKGPAEPPPRFTTPLPNMPATPPAAPKSTNQFDFMLKDPMAPQSKFYLPTNLPKPALILVLLVPIIVLGLIASSIFNKGDPVSKQVLSLAAQTQEMIRISTSYQHNFSDASVLNVSVTATATLTSQQSEYLNYLTAKKIKYKQTDLNADLSQANDTSMQNAIQANNFDNAYLVYLRGALQKYQVAMNNLPSQAKTSHLCVQLQSGQGIPTICTMTFGNALVANYQSNKTLLNSPQFSQS